MKISDNLYYLRKRDRITQEELADRLGVSRQAVSKWETGEAYPETDKLLSICDMYGVSLDALMRTDLTAAAESSDISPAPAPKAEKTSETGFDAHMNGFARAIAAGVFLILSGVAACLILCAFSFTAADGIATLLEILAGAAVILFVVPAVFLFVMFGMSHDRFMTRHPVMKSDYSDEEKNDFSKKFTVSMACLVSGILLDVVAMIVLLALVESGIIPAADKDGASCFVLSGFFVVLAFVVGGIVSAGIRKSKYDTDANGTVVNATLNPGLKPKIAQAIESIVMLSCVAVYLVLGFVFNLWHPGWVVFPVGGIVCAVVSTIDRARRKDDEK